MPRGIPNKKPVVTPETVDAAPVFTPPKKKAKEEEILSLTSTEDILEQGKDTGDMYAPVKINLGGVRLNIAFKEYGPGVVTVPRHMVDTIFEMADKKRRADAAIHVGNNFLVTRLADRTLVVQKVDKI